VELGIQLQSFLHEKRPRQLHHFLFLAMVAFDSWRNTSLPTGLPWR
jgi:hypothetical protein